ncbi:MAG: hypothetical protein N4J56_001745 [Chroococcidiopsis sp. SAG 2025]|nr:hypothetical protein [Chroococcidiopsis sp. SAG 2025]
MESSDSTQPQRGEVKLPQSHMQQGVQALENSYEQTPEITPDVDPEEVKPMGRLSRLEKALASEAA